MAAAPSDSIQQTYAEQFLAQLRAKPTLAAGLFTAVGAVVSTLHSAITGNPVTANIAISLFKTAFMAPSLQGLIAEWQKEPSDRNTVELLKRVLENISLAVSAISPWGPMAEYIALAIVATAPVPSLVASSIPGFSRLYQVFIGTTSTATAVLGGISLSAEDDIKKELLYANLAGALLSLSFMFLDVPDVSQRIFAAGTVLTMLASAGIQIASACVDMPILFPLALLCIAMGAFCVNSKLLTLGIHSNTAAGDYHAAPHDAEAGVEAGTDVATKVKSEDATLRTRWQGHSGGSSRVGPAPEFT